MDGWLGGWIELIVMNVTHSQGPVIIYRLGWVGKFWYETSLKYLMPPQGIVIFSCTPQMDTKMSCTLPPPASPTTLLLEYTNHFPGRCLAVLILFLGTSSMYKYLKRLQET